MIRFIIHKIVEILDKIIRLLGGLIVGTILSLLDIPIMHTLVDDMNRSWSVHVRKRDPATLPPVE